MRASAVAPGDVGGALLQAGEVLPETFQLPPLPYTALLVIGLLGVAALLYALSPPVRNATVIALAPWMMVGGVVHAIRGIQRVPAVVEPLLGTPAVYVTVAVVAGLVWVVGTFYEEMGPHSADRVLGVVGTALVVTLVVLAIIDAFGEGRLEPLPVALAIAGTLVAFAITWVVLMLYFTESAALTSWAGGLVVLGHALDGATTAVGHDMLDAQELTPLSARVLEVGDALPTEPYIGGGWLFVLVKLLLASMIVVLFRDWVRESPQRARLLLAIVAGLGLGPGTNNLLVFLLGG